MTGPSARSECRCSQRASSSLPVPLSPSTRTVADTLAILPASVMTSRIAPLPSELEDLVAAASAAIDAALTPFAADPSLDVSAVQSPLTDEYLATHCPDLASIGVGDQV